MGPQMTSFRLTRARYYDTKIKDKNAFIKDLEDVIAWDPHTTWPLFYPWAAFNRSNAQELLAKADEYFK